VKTAVLLLFVSMGWAQPLRVYSEFAQIETKPDTAGKVTAPAEPREILSPAIARNAFSSFQVVVDVPRGTPYQLYIAQNPENAVEVTLYRENGDKLEKVSQPVSGNSTQVFWMDLWTARDAPVARIKVEPPLHVNNDWVIYPMEARVMNAAIPPVAGTPDPVCRPPAGLSSDLVKLRHRNAQQDAALAAMAPKDELQKLIGACNESNPESYLRIRDYLLRLR
jgi:hypothetical protein